ncbi:hypothetical protein J6590_025438 [Homalodisca vitripennis]|nr:hypothetical protein J6590_025438 [Homalodisca vitripennis]
MSYFGCVMNNTLHHEANSSSRCQIQCRTLQPSLLNLHGNPLKTLYCWVKLVSKTAPILITPKPNNLYNPSTGLTQAARATAGGSHGVCPWPPIRLRYFYCKLFVVSACSDHDTGFCGGQLSRLIIVPDRPLDLAS